MERRVASTGENETRAPGVLHRLLSIFAEVKPREVFSVLVLTLNVFLLLTGYYLLKVVREPLILAGGGLEIGGQRLDLDGPEVKAYAAAGQALLLVGVPPGWASVTFAIGAFVLGTVVQEFWRGVRARQAMLHESAPLLFKQVTLRTTVDLHSTPRSAASASSSEAVVAVEPGGRTGPHVATSLAKRRRQKQRSR